MESPKDHGGARPGDPARPEGRRAVAIERNKMLTIYKYQFETTDEFFLQMPEGSRILSVHVQRDKPCMWAAVDPGRLLIDRRFVVYGTGHPIDPAEYDSLSFVGTYLLHGGQLVFHLFAEKD
jgi:hypothetical protein